jgi:uracil phosphoribosyltransferase
MPTPHDHYPNLRLFNHPLIQHKLTILRNRTTSHRPFRAVVSQIAGLMVFEVTRLFPTEPVEVETPLEKTTGTRLARPVTVVPVLRAGLAMAEGVLEVMPEARVGHIGLLRDEKTLRPVTYLSKLPHDVAAGPVILVDPMLATGGSASRASQMLLDAGVESLFMLCLLAAPPGVERMAGACPNVSIYTAALDERLDEKGYIHPGLGDAGDRLYGT